MCFLFKVIGQPYVQQTLSLLLPLLGFFIQALDPQLISQVRIVGKLSTLISLTLNSQTCFAVAGNCLGNPEVRSPFTWEPCLHSIFKGMPEAVVEVVLVTQSCPVLWDPMDCRPQVCLALGGSK